MVETVGFPTLSGSAQGQFAAPALPGPGLLLLPDVTGLAPWLLARAEWLAGAGVWTLVGDLLGRDRMKQTSSPSAGGYGVGFDSLRPVRRHRTVKPSGVPGQ
jgi:dienelactone hydrolase